MFVGSASVVDQPAQLRIAGTSRRRVCDACIVRIIAVMLMLVSLTPLLTAAREFA
jgi:hypothetical protein